MIIRPRRSRATRPNIPVDDLSGCPVHCEKTADRIRMPFGIIGRTGPGMRQVVGFGDRSTGRGTFGGEFRARHCNQWGLTFAATRPSSQMGRLVIIIANVIIIVIIVIVVVVNTEFSDTVTTMQQYSQTVIVPRNAEVDHGADSWVRNTQTGGAQAGWWSVTVSQWPHASSSTSDKPAVETGATTPLSSRSLWTGSVISNDESCPLRSTP